MTILTERSAASSSTAVADTTSRGGSYVTLPAGSVPAGVEGSYATVAGVRNLPPVTRGSYVTVDGTPVVAAGNVEGSYVTLPTAA